VEPDVDDTVLRGVPTSPVPRQAAAASPAPDAVSDRPAPDPVVTDPVVGTPVVAAPVVADPGDTAPMPEPLPAGSMSPRYGFRVGPAGRTVLLDAVAFVGRSPSSPRIQHGVLPRLIRVPSPRNEVSGTHLEVRQLGTSIVVTDLRSTNGSVVTVPGSEPHALRRGESMVVTPGTLVDIGDGNVIEILPLQRRPEGFTYV
jgi:hypothetical protein